MNLSSGALNNWEWDPENPNDSLDKLRNHCIKFSTETINWYNRRKGGQQFLAKSLRSISILLGGLAAILLISSQQKGGAPVSWTTSLMVIAGTLVALDRFFGFTNAWIRFIETANTIRVMQRKFLLDWEEQEVGWKQRIPQKKEIEKALELARTYVNSVDATVTSEIAEWAQQFRSSVTRHNNKIDEFAKSTANQS